MLDVISYSLKGKLESIQTGNVSIEKTSEGGLNFYAQKNTANESKVSFTKDELIGVGIKSIEKNANGDTILTYTNNETENIGRWNGKNAVVEVVDDTEYKYTLKITYKDDLDVEHTITTPNLKALKYKIKPNENNTSNSFKIDINTYDEEGNKTTFTSDELMPEKYDITPKSTNNKYDYRLDIEKTKNDGTKETKTTANLKGNEIWEGKDLIGNEIVFEVVADDGNNYSRINDLYINTNTNDIYRRTDKGNVNNLWEKVGNIQGKEGNDAYEVAVEEGFKGTRSEWLKSLMGESLGSQIVWEKPSIHDENTMLKVWYYYKVDALKYGNGSAWLNRYNIPTNKDYEPGTYSFYNGINYLTFTSTRGVIPANTEKYATQFYVLYDEKNSQVKLYAENRETGENSVLSDWMEITKSSSKPEGSETVHPAGEIIQYGTWVQTIYLGNSKENAYDCTIATGADVSGFITSEEFKTTIGSDDLKTDRIDVKGAINEIFDMLKSSKDTILETTNKTLFEAVNELLRKKHIDCYKLEASDLLNHCLSSSYKTLTTNFIYCYNCTGVPESNNGYGYAMLVVSNDTFYRQIVFFDPSNGKISINNIGSNETDSDFGSWSGWNSELTSNDITQTINSSSTATQVLSAKGIYDILSSSYVSSTVINGIDLNTVTNMGEYYSVNCTNKPINNDGYLKVYKCDDTNCLQEYSPITTPTKYIREQVKGSWTDWQKVCTTKTADTGVMNITFNPNDNYENNNCKYFIKNGICTIFLYIKCNTPNTRSITVAKVPKALNFYIVDSIISTSDYTFLKCSVNAIGSLQINGGTEGTTYRGIITYPVA